MKRVELTHAEVTAFYDSTDILREHKTDKGATIINFNIKTRVNDRVANSPLIFEKCNYFADTEEKAKKARETIKAGSILDITGTQERNSFEDKKTKKMKYYDSIRVKTITPISVTQAAETGDGLPF